MNATKRTDAEILKDLLNVECALSPENIYQDGEISHSAGKRRARPLLARRAKLIAELGRNPSLSEIWDQK